MKTLYGALVALALVVAAPARAEDRDYRINGWVADDRTVLATGHISYAARAVGVPIFLAISAAFGTTWRAIPGSGVADGFCNQHPEGCAPEHFGNIVLPPQELITVSAEWAPSFLGGSELPRLLLRFSDPNFRFNQLSSEGFNLEPFALTIATPGPVAGTGLPVLVGLLGAWFFRRRFLTRTS